MTKLPLCIGVALATAGLGLAACGSNGSDLPPASQSSNSDVAIADDAVAGGDPKCIPSYQSTGNAPAVRQYCLDFGAAVCQRAFSDCATQLSSFASSYANASECNSAEQNLCDGDFSSLSLEQTSATACINTLSTGSCSVYTGGEPQECTAALIALPPSSDSCTPIGPGSLQGEIAASDPLYAGGHIKKYCLCLNAGQTIDILTADPGGGAIPDSYLFLFGPDGKSVAESDDIAPANFFSHIVNQPVPAAGSYMIVVSGYHDNDLGAYRLTVRVQ